MVFRTTLLAAVLLGVAALPSRAQSEVRLSGLAYLDYAYVIDDPSSAGSGDNGFSYRRLYLTGDFTMSENVSFRARLEAADDRTNADGLPVPFVKDLSVRWQNAFAQGHEVTLGVTSPPAYEASEKFFGYRSLAKTQMDLRKIVSSRDFGVKLQGPLAASNTVRYAVMFANDSSVMRETDRTKRVYGQVEILPVDGLTVTLGGDYAAMDEGSTVTGNAFAGYRMDRMRFGAEFFVSPVRPDEPASEVDRSGLSVFAAVTASPSVEILARYDRFARSVGAIDTDADYGILGAAFTVEKSLRLIPNLVLDRAPGADDPMLTGRITVEANF